MSECDLGEAHRFLRLCSGLALLVLIQKNVLRETLIKSAAQHQRLNVNESAVGL